MADANGDRNEGDLGRNQGILGNDRDLDDRGGGGLADGDLPNVELTGSEFTNGDFTNGDFTNGDLTEGGERFDAEFMALLDAMYGEDLGIVPLSSLQATEENKTKQHQSHQEDVPDKREETGGQRQRGRPVVLDERARRQVCKLLSMGVSQRQAAAFLEMGASTLSMAARRDPEFAQQMNKAMRMYQLNPLLHIVQAAKKSWRAAAWLLDRRSPHPQPRRQRNASFAAYTNSRMR